MAYSDYGGFGYRNGEKVIERSDAVLTPDGMKSTPGQWPGWTLPEGRHGDSFHVVLGDGPIFVCLYKQSWFEIHRLGEELQPNDFIVDPKPEYFTKYLNDATGKPYINTEHFRDSEEPCTFLVDGHRITFFWVESDNHYQFCKVEQPDGTVWTGFSGYGVGAGLEDAGYGYSTRAQEDALFELFPQA